MFTRQQAIDYHWQRYRNEWPEGDFSEDFPYDFRFQFGLSPRGELLDPAPGWEWMEVFETKSVVMAFKDKTLSDLVKVIEKSDLPQ